MYDGAFRGETEARCGLKIGLRAMPIGAGAYRFGGALKSPCGRSHGRQKTAAIVLTREGAGKSGYIEANHVRHSGGWCSAVPTIRNLTHPQEAAPCRGPLCAPARPPAAVEQAPADDRTPMTRQDDPSSPASARRTRSVRCALASLIGTFMVCRTPCPRRPRGKSWARLSSKSSQSTCLRDFIIGGPAARPRSPAPRALPRRPSWSAHWSRGGAKIPCFRSPPCARQR